MTSKPNHIITFKAMTFSPAPDSSIQLFKNLLFICKEINKCRCSSYYGLELLDCNIIGAYIGSPCTLNNFSTFLLIEGTLMISIRDTCRFIISNTPFMLIFKYISLVFRKLETGGSLFVGGGGGSG